MIMREFGPFRYWGKLDPTGRTKPAIVAQVPEPAVDGSTATLRLYDPIDSYGEFWGVSAQEFLTALDSLPPSVTAINLHINSPGGEVYEGVAITNALRRHPAYVTSIVDGLAASAASFVAVGGSDKVVMGQNTEMMIHDAWGITVGPAADHHFMGDRLDGLSDSTAAIYQSKGGGTIADWRALMLAETWYSAQEAVDAGLADEVEQTSTGTDGGQPADRFDLTGFKHGGRAQAPPPPTAEQIRNEADRRARFTARALRKLERSGGLRAG